jgi:hypothetical protein
VCKISAEWHELARTAATIPIICEIRFLAAADGTVKRIDITRDTWGWWEISRCAELLNRD